MSDEVWQEIETEYLMSAIEQQRAANNKLFMEAWRLLHKHCPDDFRRIQREIRAGDLKISELNAKLCE